MRTYIGDDIEIADNELVSVGTSDPRLGGPYPVYMLTEGVDTTEYWWMNPKQARALAAQLIAAADYAEGR